MFLCKRALRNLAVELLLVTTGYLGIKYSVPKLTSQWTANHYGRYFHDLGEYYMACECRASILESIRGTRGHADEGQPVAKENTLSLAMGQIQTS